MENGIGTYPRACYTGPKTAVHIEEALVRKLGEYEITVLDNAMAYRLLKKGDRIVGLAAADVSREEVFLVGTPAVILATGGPGSAYKYNVYPSGMSGDGWAMAYEAGAELVNVEFIQFMISSVKTKLLLSGSMMRAVPRIVNELDEEILYKYLPVGISPQEVHNLIFSKGYQFPVSYEHPSHILDLAVFQECRAGHQVFIDFTRNPEGFLFEQINETFRARYQTEMVQDLGAGQRQDCPMNRLLEINPQALDIYKERGIDIAAGERIEVASAAQHFQGGVKMDAHGRTKVPGLWAVGETAGGHHGANRPGGNALMDCQVFGKIAGEDAAVVAAAAGDCRCTPDELIRLADVLFDSSISFDQERIKTVRSQIRNLLDQFAGVIRTQEGLSRAIEALEELENEVKQPCGRKGLAIALENRNMWFCALAILCASKLRNESRGPHLMFTDEKASALVPKDDLFWKKYIVLRQEGGKLVLSVKTPEQTT